jgi:carboxypeptidase Q
MLEQFTVNMVQPNFSPVIGFPKAWSPSTPKAIRGTPIYLDAKTEKELDQYRGKLHKAIVMLSSPREVKALFEPPAKRQTDESLLALANSVGSTFLGSPLIRSSRSGDSTTGADAPTRAGETIASDGPVNAGGPVGSGRFSGTPEQRAAYQLLSRKIAMAYEEGAAVLLDSGRGDGGTMFVGSASLPTTRSSSSSGDSVAVSGVAGSSERGGSAARRPSPWSKDAPEVIPQVVLAVEHYNRIIRMLQKGVPVELEIDIASRFYEGDLMSFNVIAEIPGSDLKDEIVMLGAHFDSWHSGTGATDNAVGCAVALESVRILQAIGAKPRRTIRVALWTGEEQGLLGSKAYVADHFGRNLTPTRSSGPSDRNAERSAGNESGPQRKEGAGQTETKPKEGGSPDEPKKLADPSAKDSPNASSQPERTPPKYEIKPDHAKFAGYFNLDNGTGKIRGVFLQNNEAVRPIFRTWLTPFASMGASTVSLSNTGGTDHQSFDGIGLPGFQFIQDPLEYNSRTHHSSMDVFDRLQPEDMKQASIIMASFVYHAAMRDEKLPRKPLVGEIVNPTEPQQ